MAEPIAPLDLSADDVAPRPVRSWMIVLAVLAAAVGGLFAPDPWPAGSGEVALSLNGAEVARVEVAVGDATPIDLTGEVDGLTLHARLPGGVPVDAPVRATIGATRGDDPVRLGLGEVALAIELPDGRSELVPMLHWDAEANRLGASRRPPVGARFMLAVLGLVVVLWVTEIVPLWVTSLLVPVAIVVTGAGGARAALAPFFDPIIALFFGGFLMAEGMKRVGLDRRIAVSLVSYAGRSPAMLFAALLGVSAFLSMWMSNTASTAILLPIALAVTAPIGHAGFRKAAVLGLAYAATIGGVGSAIGTPANPIAMRFLGTYVGRDISFAGWFAFGLPLVVVFLPIMGVYLWKRSDVRVDPEAFAKAREVARGQLAELGRFATAEWVVLVVILATMALWLTQKLHGLNNGVIALIGALAMALLGKVKTEDLQRISWSSLLTFGGGLTLGVFLTETGVSDWLATLLAGLAGTPPLIGITVVAIVTLAITTVASNTATAAMLVPLALPLAGVLGIDPTQLVVVVAIASSIDFALVIGTPPTLFAYSTRLFTPSEIFRTGIVLDLIGIAILVVFAAWFWGVVGLV